MELGQKLQIIGRHIFLVIHYLVGVNAKTIYVIRYFGVQGRAQMSSALLTATGSTHSLLTIDSAFKNTSLFHMYALGMTDIFNYGDCGY